MVVVRARPVRWSCAPSGGWPGVVGTVARAAATRRGRWWARWRNSLHGASVGRVCWGRCCLARGSQAGKAATLSDWRVENGDAHYKIPRFIYPRHVAASCTRGPNYYNSSPSPQATRIPPQGQFHPKVARRPETQKSHNNYLPLGVVFDPENQDSLSMRARSRTCRPLVFIALALVLCGFVSFDHLVEFLGTCEVFRRYPCCVVK